MDRRFTRPKRFTSPTWGPPPHVNRPLDNLNTRNSIKKDSNSSFVEKIWNFKLSIFQRVEFSIEDTDRHVKNPRLRT